MSTGKPRDASKERFWRRMLRQWRRSGLSAHAFCEQYGLSQPSLYAWRRTIANRDADAVHFVPVQVLPPETPAASGSAAPGLERLDLDESAVALPDRHRCEGQCFAKNHGSH